MREMQLDPDRARLADAWRTAADDLGLSIESPFECTLASGERLCVPVLVREFGARRGMLIDTSGLFRLAREIERAGFGFSEMSPPRPGAPYVRWTSIEVLRDWGWTGPLEARPTWLETRPIRVREPQPTICAGRRELCAIEAVVEAEAEPDWIFGRLFLWIEGRRLGHDHGLTALNGCRNWIEALARDEVDRRVPELADLDATGILAALRRAVFDDGGPASLVQAAARCDLTDIGVDALDAYEIYLLEDCDGDDRVVWRQRDASEAHEARFPARTLRRVAAEFVERFDATV